MSADVLERMKFGLELYTILRSLLNMVFKVMTVIIIIIIVIIVVLVVF